MVTPCEPKQERSGNDRRHLCDKSETIAKMREKLKSIDEKDELRKELNSQKFSTLEDKIKTLTDFVEKNEAEQKETIKEIFGKIDDMNTCIQKMPIKIIKNMSIVLGIFSLLAGAFIWVSTSIPH
jgi:hypothetical protein